MSINNARKGLKKNKTPSINSPQVELHVKKHLVHSTARHMNLQIKFQIGMYLI